MAHYIGSNDRETLLGVLELLALPIRNARHRANGNKTVRDRLQGKAVLEVLLDLHEQIEAASKRGPTPTPEQLAGLTITIPPDTALALKIDARLTDLGYRTGRGVGWYCQTDPRDSTVWKYKVGHGIWSPPFPDELSALEALMLSLEEELTELQGGAEAIADHLANGEVWHDGTWEDPSGVAVPTVITAPKCDRTCLPCQGGDHDQCAMSCHDEQWEREWQGHQDAHDAGSDTLIERDDCAECQRAAALRAQDAQATAIGFAMLGIPPGDPRRKA